MLRHLVLAVLRPLTSDQRAVGHRCKHPQPLDHWSSGRFGTAVSTRSHWTIGAAGGLALLLAPTAMGTSGGLAPQPPHTPQGPPWWTTPGLHSKSSRTHAAMPVTATSPSIAFANHRPTCPSDSLLWFPHPRPTAHRLLPTCCQSQTGSPPLMPPVAGSATAGTLVDNLQPAENLWQSICAPMVNQLPARCQPIANPLPTHCQLIANPLPNHGRLPSPDFASLQCASAARGGAATAGTLGDNLQPADSLWQSISVPMVNQLPTHCQPWPTHCQPIANHRRLPSPSGPSSSVRPRGMEAPRAGQPAYSRCCQHDPTTASTCIVRRAHSARGMALGNGAPKQWGPTGPSAALVPFLHPLQLPARASCDARTLHGGWPWAMEHQSNGAPPGRQPSLFCSCTHRRTALTAMELVPSREPSAQLPSLSRPTPARRLSMHASPRSHAAPT